MRKIILCLCLFAALCFSCTPENKVTIWIHESAENTVIYAAKELRRYIYLRSDILPVIREGSPEPAAGISIILSIDTLLQEQEFSLKTTAQRHSKTLAITGGSPQALLYGAYEFAEQLGIRFYLHGDVIPDKKTDFSLPELDIHRKPLFVTRGILPFHDFPEGPDWWNENDYKAIIAQLPKLKMNFIGFHTYPWRTDFNGEGPKAEPLVWIGREDEVNDDGTVKTAYPVLHFHTADSTWGYSPANPSDFLSGACRLFETHPFGPDYMKGISPWPHTDEENINIFNESGKVFAAAFSMARELGVKICVGTETPLVIPQDLKVRYGITTETKEDIKLLYCGMFYRIQQTYPIDYYWLWTPENWTWSGVEDKEVAKTERDMLIAREVLEEMGNPFTLATCGWVLGPPKDRTQFDRVLPQDMPFSCINRGLGYTPVDKGFRMLAGRSKWSIPWMEDDPALLTAQLWAGRMRKDAADSWKYGCDGLLGIHWRTRNIGPTLSALAKAAWQCDRYDTSMASRDLPVEDFYTDWAKAEFGIDDPELVKIFTVIDGKGTELKEGYKGDALLNASDWIVGPGALMVNRELNDIQERIARYEFISKLASFRPRIQGAGNLERFDYWLNVFRFNKAVLEATYAQIELNQIIDRIKKEADTVNMKEIAAAEAIPKRIELAEKWKAMNRILLSFVSTNGELGTIANLEMHNIRKNGNLTGHDAFLKTILQSELPEKAVLSDRYTGKTRIVATTNPTVLEKGDDFYLRIRVLSEKDSLSGTLFYRKLGDKKYAFAPFLRLASNVFEVKIPAASLPDDFEYYIEVVAEEEKVYYPATYRKINNTVVIINSTQ
jgi:hypothetical protein